MATFLKPVPCAMLSYSCNWIDPTNTSADGVGGGISSTSKVAIVGPSTQESCDIDYEFVQVSLTKQIVENNQTAAILRALQYICPSRTYGDAPRARQPTTLRIWQTNTNSNGSCSSFAHMSAAHRNPRCRWTGAPILVRWLAPKVGRDGRQTNSSPSRQKS